MIEIDERNDNFLENEIDQEFDFENENGVCLINERKGNGSEFLVIHLNVNSIQNKFELKVLNRQLKAHVIFLSETKIDGSYPSS